MGFSSIVYTRSVRAAQTRYGSRAANAVSELMPSPGHLVTEPLRQFLQQTDTFFMASVGETGWPYVQHRGGPKGFLKVLDRSTLGFADFAGNRQYISTGNLTHEHKVALILMDFARQRRVKILGRVSVVHQQSHPELMLKLAMPNHSARIERGFVIDLEAFDFNCPQHIVPRFTQEEIAIHYGPLLDELARLRRAAKERSGA